ncbi:MAG: hypothetical protein ACRD7E_32735 [Bryobacteraceae bacterium]
MNAPLAYSLAAFQRGGYREARGAIEDLQSLGFRWLTFTPTYLVYDEIPPRIDTARGPDIEEVEDAVLFAAEAGFGIRLEPHLDWEATLTGGPYEWRRRMLVQPDEAYSDAVAAPLVERLGGATRQFTLGSELDVSLVQFGEEWLRLLESLRSVNGSLEYGHKLNHDVFRARKAIRQSLNAERVRHGLRKAGRFEYRDRMARAGAYLARLNYAAFSFYPDMGEEGDLARGFAEKAQALVDDLRTTAGPSPAFSIGEFGLGCADPARPWHVDASSFDSEDAMELRRRYYLEFLECLRRRPDLFGEQPSTFWTVGHFDFLGALQQFSANAVQPRFRDDRLRQAVLQYNQEASPA